MSLRAWASAATALALAACGEMATLPVAAGTGAVAETDAPPKAEGGHGICAWLMGLVMRRAGAVTPSADRITLPRDADGDGVAELRTVLIAGLHSPFGMALVGRTLYVADTDAVRGFPYAEGDTRIEAPGLADVGNTVWRVTAAP